MTYVVTNVGFHVDPDQLLIVEVANSPPVLAWNVRYVSAVDQDGRRVVAIELSHDALGGSPAAPYFCPEPRIVRRLVPPKSVRLIRPYRES